MTGQADETAAAFDELVDLVRALPERFAGLDRLSVLEGYAWALSILQVGTEAFLWGDTQRPRFVDIVGPTKKWGGDNTDAFYQYAPVDPSRTYRVVGEPGDAVYWSLTVYGGPDDGRYSERIVGSASDRDVARRRDGTVEIVLSAREHEGAWIRLEPDAVAVITRDYLVEPDRGRRMLWRIECLDGATTPPRQTDADVARRLRAVRTWVEEQAKITPLPPPAAPNTVDPPYPVPQQTFGWAAGDAAYAMGAFDLADDEALVLRGRSPQCAFWNLCLWNPFLHTYDAAYDRVTINGGQVHYEPDGSWVIVVAPRDPGHPNWVGTQGHRAGRLWFRWFFPAATPEPIETEVIANP